MSSLTRPDTKRCSFCCQEKPVTEFHRRVAGTEIRQSRCKPCHNEQRRLWTLRKQGREAHEYARQVTRNAADKVALLALTQDIIGKFGGLDQFMNRWKSAIDEAVAVGKHHLVARSMLAILHLSTAASEVIEESHPRLERMDDDDLARRMDAAVINIVAQNPELAVNAAAKMGWTVIPPITEASK